MGCFSFIYKVYRLRSAVASYNAGIIWHYRYISFVFIPNNKYIYVTNNQIVALLSFVLYCFLGFLIAKDIYVLVISIAMSGLTEIVYCKYLIRKNNWLKN